MKKLITLALTLTILGCGNNGNNNSSAPSAPPLAARTRDSDRQLDENDLRQIEALDGKTFGQVVVGLSRLSDSRALNTQDLSRFLDQKLSVKCSDICQFRRKGHFPRR